MKVYVFLPCPLDVVKKISGEKVSYHHFPILPLLQDTKVHLQRSQDESEKNMREFLEAKQKAAQAAAE